MQVLRVEEVRARGRHSTRRSTSRTIRLPVDLHATIQDHVRVHELEACKTKLRRLGTGEPLKRLQRRNVERPHDVVDHDQVGTIAAPNQLRPHAVEVVLDVRRRNCSTTSRSTPEVLVAPEQPRIAIDAANNVGGGGADLLQQTIDLLTTSCSAVAVQPGANQVVHRAFANIHTTIEQVDDLFLGCVLQLLQTAHRNWASSLLDRVFSCADGILRCSRQGLVARVPSGVPVGRKRNLLHDGVTTGERLDVAALLESRKQGIVAGYVILDLTRARLDRSRDDVTD